MAGESQVRPKPDAMADRSPDRAAASLSARDAAHLWHPYTQMLTRPAPIPVVRGEGVYLFTDDAWVPVGNIRTSAAENLTGETGAAGDTGATGATGAPGTPGTQILLETTAPKPESCQADGDIYIYLNADTEAAEFYECTASKWTLVWPLPTAGAATPSPTADSNG